MSPRPSAVCASRSAKRPRPWPNSSVAALPATRSGSEARPRPAPNGFCGCCSSAPTKRPGMPFGSAPSAARGRATNPTSPRRMGHQCRSPRLATPIAATWRIAPSIYSMLPLRPVTRQRASGFAGSLKILKALLPTSAGDQSKLPQSSLEQRGSRCSDCRNARGESGAISSQHVIQ